MTYKDLCHRVYRALLLSERIDIAQWIRDFDRVRQEEKLEAEWENPFKRVLRLVWSTRGTTTRTKNANESEELFKIS